METTMIRLLLALILAFGIVPLASGAAGFLVIVLHVGFGLQLRRPKLKERVKKRRMHAATAIALSAAVIVHIVVLLRSA